MSVALFLSPHLDDAILSCAGRILRHVAHGDRVVLLTVFSHADPEDHADWAARRREDERAAARLGAHPQWLGLPDAPFRDPQYADFAAITGPHAPGDAAWRERLTARLRAEVEALEPATLYAPLGVGDHVDHRLVHEAACTLAPTPLFYEDHPYALVAHAVRRRLDALGLRTPAPPSPPPIADYLAALASAPYVSAYLPPGPARERCFTRLEHWPTSSPVHPATAELEPLEPAAAALAEQAIWDYASQAPALFGTRERYRALVRAYAEPLRASAPRAERYWRAPTLQSPSQPRG